MHTHSAMSATSVENGRAVLDDCAQTKRFRMNVVAKSKPGSSAAVYRRRC